MTPEVGKTYYRKAKSGHALVVRVLAVAEWVEYRVVHGPKRAMSLGTGRCKVGNFVGRQEIEERDNYSDLDGCKIFATFLVLDTRGEPLLRCSQKRAAFYLKKGFARPLRDGVLQFTDDQTEKRMRELYEGPFSQFFLAIKNGPVRLLRHAQQPFPPPRRPQATLEEVTAALAAVSVEHPLSVPGLPPPLRAGSRTRSEFAGDWQEYAGRWKHHFIETLNPRHLPAGWDIVSVDNHDALREWP